MPIVNSDNDFELMNTEHTLIFFYWDRLSSLWLLKSFKQNIEILPPRNDILYVWEPSNSTNPGS